MLCYILRIAPELSKIADKNGNFPIHLFQRCDDLYELIDYYCRDFSVTNNIGASSLQFCASFHR